MCFGIMRKLVAKSIRRLFQVLEIYLQKYISTLANIPARWPLC